MNDTPMLPDPAMAGLTRWRAEHPNWRELASAAAKEAQAKRRLNTAAAAGGGVPRSLSISVQAREGGQYVRDSSRSICLDGCTATTDEMWQALLAVLPQVRKLLEPKKTAATHTVIKWGQP